jgi:hypothetical protein
VQEGIFFCIWIGLNHSWGRLYFHAEIGAERENLDLRRSACNYAYDSAILEFARLGSRAPRSQ